MKLIEKLKALLQNKHLNQPQRSAARSSPTIHPEASRMLSQGQHRELLSWIEAQPPQEQLEHLGALLGVLSPALLSQHFLQLVRREPRCLDEGFVHALAALLPESERAAFLQEIFPTEDSRRHLIERAEHALREAESKGVPYHRAISLHGLEVRNLMLAYARELSSDEGAFLQERLCDARLALLRLPPSSQPYRLWRFQLFSYAVPPTRLQAVRHAIERLPLKERLLALVQFAPRAPEEIRALARQSLIEASGPIRWMGIAHALSLFPKEEQAALQRELYEVAAELSPETWSAQWEQAIDLWRQNDGRGLAFVRGALAEALPQAERESLAPKLIADHREQSLNREAGELVRWLPHINDEALKAAILSRAVSAYCTDEVMALLSVRDLPDSLPLISASQREVILRFMRERCDDVNGRDWLRELKEAWPLLTEEERSILFSAALTAVRQGEEGQLASALGWLAELAPKEARQSLLEEALSRWELSEERPFYAPFHCPQPDDPAEIHRRFRALLDRAQSGVSRPVALSFLAKKAPPEIRESLLRELLDSYAALGLNEFEQCEIPFESLWQLMPKELLWEALALAEARPNDESSEYCRRCLFQGLLEAGVSARELLPHTWKMGYYRAHSFCILAPKLQIEERIRAATELFAWLKQERDEPSHYLSDAFSVIGFFDEETQEQLVDEIEHWLPTASLSDVRMNEQIEALLEQNRPERALRWLRIWEKYADADERLEGLLLIGERQPSKELMDEIRELIEQQIKEERPTWILDRHADWLPMDWLCRWVEHEIDKGEMEPLRWVSFWRRYGGQELLNDIVRWQLG